MKLLLTVSAALCLILSLLAFGLPGCKFFDPKYAPEAELSGHVAACNAKQSALIAREKAKGDACEEIRVEVELLWATDSDCKDYMLDAGHLECL